MVTIRAATPTLPLKNPEFCPHFFLSVFMTLAINTNSSTKIFTGFTRMGNMSDDCEDGTLVGVFIIPKLCFKVLND